MLSKRTYIVIVGTRELPSASKTMTSKDTLRLTGFLLFASFVIGWVSINSCNAPALSQSRVVHTYESDDTAFYNGELLLPDEIHPKDTLVVTDAKFLNRCMVEYDASSVEDIKDILRETTKKY